MKEYKNILVATDLHDQNLPAPSRAVEIARENNASLTVMTVAPMMQYYIASGLKLVTDLDKKLKKEAEAKIDYVKKQLNYKADYIVSHGIASLEIVQTAKKIKADLIVIGSHGHRGVQKILGTTVMAVLNDAPCDVLVVRIKKTKKPKEPIPAFVL